MNYLSRAPEVLLHTRPTVESGDQPILAASGLLALLVATAVVVFIARRLKRRVGNNGPVDTAVHWGKKYKITSLATIAVVGYIFILRVITFGVVFGFALLHGGPSSFTEAAVFSLSLQPGTVLYLAVIPFIALSEHIIIKVYGEIQLKRPW